nr:tumor protein p53-inducible nuclear protein 1 [Nothobranchius furzeri]XP_015805461.2 tumor protein p53-inducible nuclear protein 1 [Nothobranchius furzeri]
MFQRFASALFGDNVDQLSQCSRPGDSKEEQEDDWILVNYLADTCSSQCGEGLSRSTVSPDDDEEEEEEEDLVMIPSPIANPAIRYPSCTSLNSTADTDLDGAAEDEDVDEEEGGFLHLDACSLEESWFVTPPPCFTGHNKQPILLETSPLENLLIEHPSMSVYAHHGPLRLARDPLPPRSLRMEFLSTNPTASGKEKARHALEGAKLRPEVAVFQRRSSLHSPCYAAALSAHTGLLQQRPGNVTQRTQSLSRKALRRLNLLRPLKPGTMHLNQPSQRHFNF